MQKKHQYKEEAIPLLAYDPDSQKYVINDEALEFISGVPAPIGVVGVAGMYRTGKSYLLNQMLLNRSDGFGVGPTVNPCTKGLWIWGKPLLGQTVDGENINILVIDSEGIGALDEDSTHDSRIFALAVLLSSCFIYNSVGSIDETAIQNLSLVVNLTKNIQIKNVNNEQQEPDFEDFSVHFPSFFWVLRDFSLQLQDTYGEPISQKQYLEMALADQKGFTDAIEQKNKIRKCLTSFFKDRDCYTLVRPLTNEENLQTLDKMPFDQLRPEFFEQVINLRKRILTKMKKKQLLGKSLNGDMFVDLIKSYVNSINEGALPNIQTAWQYLCENECLKAVQFGIDIYDQEIKNVLHNKLPLTNEELKMYHQMAKEQAVDLFRKKAVGDIQEGYFKEFISKIKQRHQLIKNENEKESQRVCYNYIQMEFQSIERKLKMNEYQNYQEYDQDLVLFQNFFLENGPKTANKELFIMDFMQRALADGANYFLKSQSHESEISQTLSKEMQKKLEQDYKELKESSICEKENLKQQVQKSFQEKSELEVKQQAAEETVNEMKQEKQKLELELKEIVHHEKQQHHKQLTVMKMKLAIAEDKAKEMERQKLLGESEFDKEKALLNQKVQHFEKQLEDYNKKDKDNNADLKNVKKDYMNQLKEMQTKSDQQLKQLQQKVHELIEKNTDLEHQLVIKDQTFEIEKRKQDMNESKQYQVISDNEAYIKKLEKDLEEIKNSHFSQSQQDNLKHNQNTDEMQDRLKELEEGNKQKEELINNLKSQIQKEKALTQQKLEFYELQNKEAKQQLDENKRAHDAILSAINSASNFSDKGSDPKQMNMMKEMHKQELKNLETEFEAQKKRMQDQIDLLQEKVNENELKQISENEDLNKHIEDLKDQIEQTQRANQKLSEQNKQLELDKSRNSSAVEERYSGKIRQLEEELEEMKQKSMSDIKEQQNKSEQSLAQLKNIYEIERETLERRIAEERDKWEKKLHSANEEYYEHMRNNQGTYEEEIENLKEELRDQEANYHNVVSQYEHEIALKQQTIETLEKYINETKESLMNLHSNNNANIEQHINNFQNERKGLMDKIEQMTIEIQKKEKENLAFAQKKEQLENQIARKEQQLETLKQEYAHEKQELSDKLDDTKAKLEEISNEFLQNKIEFSKHVALSDQKNEFLQKRNDELQKYQESQINRYEEKLKQLKQELNTEMQDKVSKIEEEKTQIEVRYEKAKKTLKEIEGTYNKQLSSLEREKAIATEKLSNCEYKRIEMEQKYQQVQQTYQTQYQQLKDQSILDKKQLQQELEKFKNLNLNLEQDKNDIITNYDRDKALWEGKFQFLEQQKEQAKQDLVEALKKFETTLQHLQKARHNEKDDHESSLNELLQSMEKKYQNQIAELTENHNRMIQDYEDKLRRLNKELKQLKDSNYVEKYGKSGNQLLNEKRLAEFIENEKKLFQEIETLKAERDQKTLEYQKQLDTERESLKEKITQLEQKYKESEQKKSQQLFEFEKEKAKWSLDKDHLVQQKNEYSEALQKVEFKKEQLLRENEKLRNDQKVNKRSINLMAQGISKNLQQTQQQTQPNSQQQQQQLSSSKQNNSFLGNLKNSSLNKTTIEEPRNQKSNLNDITNYNGIMAYNNIQNDKSNTSILNTSNILSNHRSPTRNNSSLLNREDSQGNLNNLFPRK